MRFTAIVFAFGLAALSSTALADPLKPLLSDLVDNHPRIKAAAEQVNASDAGKTEAFSGYLPKVTATAGKGKENTDRTDLSPAGVKTNYSTTSASVSVSQNLFEGFRTYAASKTADVTAALAEENLDLTRQQIILEAVSSYMDVLRHMELTRLSQENQR